MFLSYLKGPILHDSDATSMEMLKRLMLDKMPLIPDVSVACCDVRDVALAHINALVYTFKRFFK